MEVYLQKGNKIKTLKFQGHGDDTFGEYGVTNEDYDNCASCKPIQCVIESEGGGAMLVVGQYAESHITGCWTIGVSMVDEDVALPGWPIRFHSIGTSYSPIMEIDVPDDIRLIWFSDGELVQAQ